MFAVKIAVFTCLLALLPFAQSTTLSEQVAAVFAKSGVPEQPATQSPPAASAVVDQFEDDFVPYNRSRHDEFDWQLIKAVLTNKDTDNVILSPFSVKLLMSLLAEASGKDTSTETELSAVLPGVGSILQARELYTRILGSLQKRSEDYQFQIGTKIYVDSFIQPKQRYAAIIESYYFTKIEQIEFAQPELAAEKINKWVNEVTQGQIGHLVKSDDIAGSVMLILNAIYFNGYWRRPFASNETFEAPFFSSLTAQQRTTFMSQTGYFFYLDSQLLDAKILRLPYKGRKFAMSLILPNNPETNLDQLINLMDSTSLQRAQYFMDEVEVRIELPKFKFDHTSPLEEVLQSLGIKAIFTSEASLPLLARGTNVQNRLQVSKILQKAGIAVNEEGSTVFAATEVVLVNKFGGDSTREFIANRPFVFLIEDESTGTLLFAGKVCNPGDFKA